MNDDFEGGEFIFTEMDAKTVTVSKPILANLFSVFYLSFAIFQGLTDCWISNISELRSSRGGESPGKLIDHNMLEKEPSIKIL